MMAHDFDLIGEAIFSTRTWEAFGEGNKNFNGIDHGSAADIRFTRNKANTVLYVTTLGWPGDGAVLKIKTLGKSRINLKSLQSVSLVGASEKLTFQPGCRFAPDHVAVQGALSVQRLPDQADVFRADPEAQACGQAALAGAGP